MMHSQSDSHSRDLNSDCSLLQLGYGTFKEKNKAAKTLWTEDQEAEIRLLWEEHKHRRDAGEDVADVILDALSDPGEKTRTQLVRQMVRMGILGSAR